MKLSDLLGCFGIDQSDNIKGVACVSREICTGALGE